MTLLGSTLVPHGVHIGEPAACRPASLDHTCGSTGRSAPTSGGSTTRRSLGLRWPRPRARPGSSPRTGPRRHGRPGGPDPAPWLTHPLSPPTDRRRPARRGPRLAARPRGPRRRPLPRPPARHRAAARVRRTGRRAGADRGGPHRRPGVRRVHSLHSYFLLPGRHDVPIIYDVERIRDGRSFATRRVVARQHGRPIYYLTASFQRPEEGFDHQDVMPDVPGARRRPRPRRPDAARRGSRRADALAPRSGPRSRPATSATRAHGLPDDPSTSPARARIWIRVNGRLSDDPRRAPRGVHLRQRHDPARGRPWCRTASTSASPGCRPASLDHTIWFHRPFRADEWWLYDQASPSASGGRGLALARVFTEDGRLVATVAQEGLIRQRS